MEPASEDCESSIDSPPSPLGVFSKIPAEIRNEIWSHFMPENRPPEPPHWDLLWHISVNCPYTPQPPRGLEILRVNRQIYQEISAMLPQPYVSKEICFSIKPVSEWSLTPHPLFVKDMPYLRIEDLGYLDFAAFESIRFEIEPPQTPGECFYMFRRQIMPIMRSIQGSQQRYTYVPDARLREVHIVFTDVGSTEQSDGSSLANGRPYDPYLDPMHFANIFVAFKTLRQIDHLYIQPRMKALDNESFQKGVAWKIKELQAITRSSYWEEAESPQAVADSLENLRLSHERNGNLSADDGFSLY